MFWRKFRKKIKFRENLEIHPDEIFLDSSNLPEFNTYQFEGRIEKPISRKSLMLVGSFFILVGVIFISRVWFLQIAYGEVFTQKSQSNSLRHSHIFADRGVIYDRNGELLVWNDIHQDGEEFSARRYKDLSGLSLFLGYVKYPAKDKAGFYYNESYEGKDGVEKFYNNILGGANGVKIIETNALGKIESENVIQSPRVGETLTLSIDSGLNHSLFESIRSIAEQVNFKGGAGVVMDIKSGEVVALASFPEYDSNILSDGDDSKKIKGYVENSGNPFLNRIIDGLYTPGSIVKPFVALAALEESIIDPRTKIISTGSISLPNIYDPSKATVFKDWKAHGAVDMREAIAVSSDVYFYEVGGGYKDQKGLGISLIEKYMRYFGFGEIIPSPFFQGKEGVIPTPKWKSDNFKGEAWTIGNTYHTSIGQYGFQITPMQELLAIAAVANDGKIVYPTIIKGVNNIPAKEVSIEKDHFKIVKEGMRLSVVNGTASALNVTSVSIAAKTGTAELGTLRQYVNSWVTGFFPYDNPRYAFVIIMEKGPRSNTIGASAVARHFFDWMAIYKPEYLREE